MNGPRRASRARPRNRNKDRGFTLVELLIAVVLSGVIAGVTVAILITALNVADTTTDAVRDSTDSGLVTAFLYRDAQSAGAIDPETGTLDPVLGVSTTDMDGCVQPGAPVVRFSWFDRTSDAAPRKVVVTYALVTDALDESVGELTRRMCKDGSSVGVDVLVGSSVSSATATCEPGPTCAGHPTSVTLVLTGAGTGTPDTRLTASVRGDATQDIPDSTNSSPVALLALGAAPAPCPNLTLNGTGAITVIGDAIVDESCAPPSPPIVGDAATLQPTGTTSTSAGLTDPFAGRQPPLHVCDPLGTNPDPLGTSPGESSVIMYHQAVSINSALPSFQAGRYVFCNGLSIGANGVLDGDGILFYVAGGQLTVDAGATVDLAASTAGDDANLLIWAASPETVILRGGPHVSSYRGFIYAPSSTLTISSEMAANIGGLIVEDVTVEGPGPIRIGLPVPELTITVSPDPIPTGQVDVVYTAATLTASGGTSPYRWSATGLPAGLAIDPTSGVISGTPTASGPFAVVVTTFDDTAAAASIDYTITVAAKLLITGPGTLPAGQVGVAYTPTTVTSSGGTSPYTWSATGLPPGLTIDPVSGQISGTPNTAGTFPDVVVTVTDAMTTASLTYTITIGLPPTVTGTIPLPDGQVGTPYVAAMTASGGTVRPAGPPDYYWSATGLPAGLTIDPDTGVISGTPGAAGTWDPVMVTVTDDLGASDTRSLVLTISAPAIPLSVAGPATLPVGEQGAVYPSTIVSATGGVPPYTWTATGLPAGLAIDLNTGAISGTPSVAGTFAVTVTVTDSAAATDPMPYTLTVVPPGCLAPAAGWRGEYFSNNTLVGNPTLCRDDADVNFDWAVGVPAPGVPADNFSVRWTRTQAFAAGNYTFTMGSDAGARLYVDGALVLNDWTPVHTYPAAPPTIAVPLTAGNHTIVMEYYETTLNARATLTMFSCTGTAVGWRGEYFSNTTLIGTPTRCRDDASPNFNWGTAAPITGVPADNFSVRWTRTENYAAGNYRFAMGSDAGARLYIDGTLVLDNWAPAHTYAATPPITVRPLTAGNHTIVMEYYETTSVARATLTSYACTGAAVGWSGEYFSNATLTGTPAECRDDASPNFNWASAAPMTGVPADNFSVRWTRTQAFTAGDYTFTMGSDAGARLYVDGALVLNDWTPVHTYPAALPTIAVPLTAGNHTIVMEYYETTSVARASLSWYECAGPAVGWRGEYFSNTTLTGTPTRCRDDASPNFNWAAAAPITGVPADNFSVRWTRTQTFTAGNYTFTMGSDAGARLYVDGALVLNDWTPVHTYPAALPTIAVPLTAGNHTIVMEYYETTSVARASLSWYECAGPAVGWRGEYFSNTTLTGTPTRCRDDASPNFNWAAAAPITGVPADNFSVRWTRTQAFTAGDYTFTMGSDAGARLYVDGALVLNDWTPVHTYQAVVPTVVVPLTAGNHTIVMEYYETTVNARATLTWFSCTGTAVGWRGEYFSNTTLTGSPTRCRDDASVNFNWAAAVPISGVPADNFSVRWTRTQAFTAGNYRFTMGSDAGARLYVDGALVIDDWTPAHTYPATPPNVVRALSAGSHTIVMEYYETTLNARATLAFVAV